MKAMGLAVSEKILEKYILKTTYLRRKLLMQPTETV